MCSTMVGGGWRLAVGGGWRLGLGEGSGRSPGSSVRSPFIPRTVPSGSRGHRHPGAEDSAILSMSPTGLEPAPVWEAPFERSVTAAGGTVRHVRCCKAGGGGGGAGVTGWSPHGPQRHTAPIQRRRPVNLPPAHRPVAEPGTAVLSCVRWEARGAGPVAPNGPCRTTSAAAEKGRASSGKGAPAAVTPPATSRLVTFAQRTDTNK